MAAETDIHAVAGLLKRYFRELPDPLFTDELYMNFVQALGLSLLTMLNVLYVLFNCVVHLTVHVYVCV